MDIGDFIAVLASEIEEAPAGSIKPEAPFRKLEGWSSMTALLVIARIDAEYNVTISAQDLATAQTVEDLYKLVESRS